MLDPNSPLNPTSRILEGNQSNQKSNVYIEGAENVPLPSLGVFYGPRPEHRNITQLRVRKINWTDEDILTTPSFLNDLSVFDELLKNTIVDENGFKASQLVPIDRDTILFYLRTKAFGSEFSIDVECPKCKQKTELKWDLSELEFPEYKPEVYEELKQNGEYKIVTPLQKIELYLKVPSIGKTSDLTKENLTQQSKEKTGKSFLGTNSLLSIISGVNIGDSRILRKKEEIISYFNKINLEISESRYIRSKLEDINLQYNTSQPFICSNKKCRHEGGDVEMPIVHQNFLWLK